jgi:tetratricopeptide (TPR) repeat protein
MVADETCRLSGPSRIVMNCDQRTSPDRNLSTSGAPAKRSVRFATCAAICFFFLLMSLCVGHASGQSDFESHLADAVSAQSAGNISAAISAYQSALAIRRDVPEVWANLGLMQHQAKDYAGALQSFETANQLQPKLFVPLLFLGIENLQLGNQAKATQMISRSTWLWEEPILG